MKKLELKGVVNEREHGDGEDNDNEMLAVRNEAMLRIYLMDEYRRLLIEDMFGLEAYEAMMVSQNTTKSLPRSETTVKKSSK